MLGPSPPSRQGPKSLLRFTDYGEGASNSAKCSYFVSRHIRRIPASLDGKGTGDPIPIRMDRGGESPSPRAPRGALKRTSGGAQVKREPVSSPRRRSTTTGGTRAYKDESRSRVCPAMGALTRAV